MLVNTMKQQALNPSPEPMSTNQSETLKHQIAPEPQPNPIYSNRNSTLTKNLSIPMGDFNYPNQNFGDTANTQLYNTGNVTNPFISHNESTLIASSPGGMDPRQFVCPLTANSRNSTSDLNHARQRFMGVQRGSQGMNLTGSQVLYPGSNINLMSSGLSPGFGVTGQHFCLEHRTISELICETDRKIICSHCALFGAHKGHQYIKFSDFKSDSSTKIQGLKSGLEKIKFGKCLREGAKEAEIIRGKVSDKREQLFSEISAGASDLIKRIREREQRVKQKIDREFSQFDDLVVEWAAQQVRLRDKAAALDLRVQHLGKAVAGPNIDIQYLLEHLDNKNVSCKSIGEEIESLGRRVGRHEGTAGKFIERELQKFEVNFEPLKLQKVLKKNIIDLHYEKSSMEGRKRRSSLNNKIKVIFCIIDFVL